MNTVRSLNTVESVDSWTDTRWQLRSMSAAINSLMVPDGVNTNMFRLRAVPPQGKVAYYEVSFEGNLMADCWKECKFFPRGDRPLQPPALTAGLSADPTDDELQQAVAAVDGTAAPLQFGTERLEGDIEVPATNNQPAMLGSLTLYQVPKALGNKQAMLVLTFDTDASPGGTGGGGSVDKP